MSTRGLLGFVADGELKAAYNRDDSYPGGLGLAVLHFVRQLVKDGGVASARQRVRDIRVVTDDTPITPADIEALASWTNHNVGHHERPDGSIDRSINWYKLTRETQGDPDAIFSSGYLLDARDFAHDSLHCENGYVIDFDAQVIEVYEGFCTKPPSAGRWVGQVADDFERQAESLGEGYYPIDRVAVISFADLPSDAGFIRLLHTAEDPGETE